MLLQVHKGLPAPSLSQRPSSALGRTQPQVPRACTAAQEAASLAYAPCPATLQRLKALQDRERGRGQHEVTCLGWGVGTSIPHVQMCFCCKAMADLWQQATAKITCFEAKLAAAILLSPANQGADQLPAPAPGSGGPAHEHLLQPVSLQVTAALFGLWSSHGRCEVQ